MNEYARYYIDSMDNLWKAIYPELWLSLSDGSRASRIKQTTIEGMMDRLPNDSPEHIEKHYEDYIMCMEVLLYYTFPIMYFEMPGKWECLLSPVRSAREQYKWQPKPPEPLVIHQEIKIAQLRCKECDTAYVVDDTIKARSGGVYVRQNCKCDNPMQDNRLGYRDDHDHPPIGEK